MGSFRINGKLVGIRTESPQTSDKLAGCGSPKMLMGRMTKKALLALLLCIISSAEASLAADPGTSENPIKCQAPEGEGAYLFRLRLQSGEKLEWNRQGSTSGEGHTGHHFDIYNSNHKHTPQRHTGTSTDTSGQSAARGSSKVASLPPWRRASSASQASVICR